MTLELIPTAQLSALEDADMAQAMANDARLNSRVDTVALKANFASGMELDIPPTAKLKRLLRAADKYCAAILPYSACRHGCSHCCNIAVTLTTTEAELIGRHIKVKPTIPTYRPDIIGNQKTYSGVPCPFLAKGKCSVYEVRPLACRVHFNMADTGNLCDTNIPATIPMIDNTQIDQIHFMLFSRDVWGDIREFFPNLTMGK